ncbi:MAG: hypothetical protein B7733_00155 [Myxococcales bacterium FL481]|nr:MAG: hypothetical protein B7733_00155 [Myxococcales bacterium FL481]
MEEDRCPDCGTRAPNYRDGSCNICGRLPDGRGAGDDERISNGSFRRALKRVNDENQALRDAVATHRRRMLEDPPRPGDDLEADRQLWAILDGDTATTTGRECTYRGALAECHACDCPIHGSTTGDRDG